MKMAVALAILVSLSVVSWAAQVELQYFWSATCHDCQVMWDFLAKLARKYPELKIVDHEVTFNPDNWRLMVTLARAYGLKEERTPTVIVGNLAVAGIGQAAELRIQREVERCISQGCPSPLERLPKKKARILSPLEVLLLLAWGLTALLYLTKR